MSAYCKYVVGFWHPKFNGSIFVGGGCRTCSRPAKVGPYCTQHARIVKNNPELFRK